MSIGYSGRLKIVLADDDALICVYYCFNNNHDDYKRYKEKYDGKIYVLRKALVKPEIHRKIKRFPNGRKRLIEKRIRRHVDFDELINTDKIIVENASGTWSVDSNGVDTMAIKLLSVMFNEYQESGEVPNIVSWDS